MKPADISTFIFDWSYPLAFVWGLLVLASFAGWGKAVGRWLVPDEGTNNSAWGLSSARGLSAFLVLSGPMVMMSSFSTTFLEFFLLAGWFSLAWHILFIGGQDKIWTGPPTLRLKIVFISLLFFIGLTYAGAVAMNIYNPYDDFAAYFSLAKMLLDTGTFYDPFSFRLLGALGGQTALDTLIVAFFSWKYANLLDVGIAGLIVLLLTQEMVQGFDRKAWIGRLLLLALVLTFHMPRTNTASELTGVILYILLFHTFNLIWTGRIHGWKAAVLLGATIMANATLRAPNIFIMALLGAGFVAWRLWEERQARGEIIREALQTILAVAVMLSPWWTVAYRSGGTFLYPFLRGTHQPEYETYSSHLSLIATLEFIGVFFCSYYYLPLFFPALVLKAGRERRFIWLMGVLLFAISLLMLAQLTFALQLDTYRYLTPMGAAFAFYAAGCVARQLIADPGERGVFGMSRAKLIVMIAAFAILFQSISFLGLSVLNVVRIVWALDARQTLRSKTIGPVSTVAEDRDYREAFDHIPRGSNVLIALDYPFLLDYRAHSIFSIDMVGASSPPPGFPYFRGTLPVKEYLLAHNIRYIAHVPFENSKLLHSRETQSLNLTGSVPAYHYFGTFEIDFFDNVDQLAKSNQIIYNSPTVQVIDIQDK